MANSGGHLSRRKDNAKGRAVGDKRSLTHSAQRVVTCISAFVLQLCLASATCDLVDMPALPSQALRRNVQWYQISAKIERRHIEGRGSVCVCVSERVCNLVCARAYACAHTLVCVGTEAFLIVEYGVHSKFNDADPASNCI